MRQTTPEKIETLAPNQVFVFGSNDSGFHGAGAAGLAFRGDAANNWRQDERFLAAMKAAPGSDLRVGRWAIYGVARGLQTGRDGKSYAVVTLTVPGRRRSTPLASIQDEIETLAQYARSKPQLQFLVTKIGCGLAGYTVVEIAGLFRSVHDSLVLPDNMILPAEFESRP